MLDKTKSCLCGSGKTYSDCCYKKPPLSTVLSMKLLGDARTHYKQFNTRCIIPDDHGVQCNKVPIHSHNLQQCGILGLLQVDGHVYEIGIDASESRFDLSFKRIGINKATLFKCICADHDRELFSKIEKEAYQRLPVQNFQLALKTNLFLYWKELAAQSVLKHQIAENNIFSSEVGVSQFIQHQIDLARIKNNFCKLIRILQESDFSKLASFVITLEYEIQFSCSIPLYFVYDLHGKSLQKATEDSFKMLGKNLELVGNSKFPPIYLTAFPQSGKSYIVLSWFKDAKECIANILDQFEKLNQNERLKLLNVLMPIVAENIILSPRLVDSWNDQQRKEYLAISNPASLDLYNSEDSGKGIDLIAWSNQVHYNLFHVLIRNEP